MVFGCFRPRAAPSETVEPWKAEMEQLKEKCAELQTENDSLVHLREQLEVANNSLATLETQVASHMEESKRIAKEARDARAAAVQKEGEHEQEVRRLTLARKADRDKAAALLAETQAKVQSLDQRVARHQRERTKLLDQINRRDKALFLARQVIDMVEKSGLLGLDVAAAFGSMGQQQEAPSPQLHSTTPPPPTASSWVKPPMAAGSVGSRRHATPYVSQQQLALDELRRSMPAMREALASAGGHVDAGEVPADTPGTEKTPSSTLRRTSSGGEGVMNPLWQPSEACTVMGPESAGGGLQALQAGEDDIMREGSADEAVAPLDVVVDVGAARDMSPTVTVRTGGSMQMGSKDGGLVKSSTRYRRGSSSVSDDLVGQA